MGRVKHGDHLKANGMHRIGETQFFMDENCRTKKVTFKQLKLAKGKRSSIQTAVGKLGYDCPELAYDKYEGGHLIGDQFDHDATRENLVPMCFQLNRSRYKTMENVWSKSLKNNVGVLNGTITISYFEGTSCPCFIDVCCTIGEEQMGWHFVHSEMFIGNSVNDTYKDLFV